MNETSASLIISCNSSNECKYKGLELPLSIKITNTGTQAISIPLDYIKKSGPTIKITDTKTGRFAFLKKNLADPQLFKQIIELKPNQATSFDWLILPTEIEQFGKNSHHLTMEVTILGISNFPDKEKTESLTISGSIEISK